MNLPLLSVIIPVFNAEKYISDAIQNVLTQGINDIEIICVDDGSTDASAAIIESFSNTRIRYFYQTNEGPASARNKGIREAKGTFITFLDADDLYPAGKLIHQLNFLTAYPDYDGIWGHSKFEFAPGSDGNLFRLNGREVVWANLLGASMFRREVFTKMGYFNEQMRVGEDTDWYFRLRDSGLTTFIDPQIALIYRSHSESMVHREKDQMHSSLLTALHQSIQRRKNARNE